MRRLVVLVALAACGDIPGKGDRAVPVEVDPRFGVAVDVPLPILGYTIVSAAGKGGVDWMAVWYDPGVDEDLHDADEAFRIFRLDPAEGFAAREIDPPPLVDRDFFLWHAFQPDQALITFPIALFAYDGDDWVLINPPVGLDHGSAAYVLVDEDRLFASSGGSIAVWDGTSWRSVPAPEGSTLGPLERDRFRSVRQGPCTIEWDFASLAPGPEVCATGANDMVGWSVNGDIDAFHVLYGTDRLRRFGEGAWSEVSGPDFVAAGMITGNAPDRVSLTIARDGLRLPDVHGVDLGVSDEVLFPATDAEITCECDRATDPTCPCANPGIAWSSTVFAADGSSLDLLLALDVNGERVLHARRFDLPVASTPFGPEDAP